MAVEALRPDELEAPAAYEAHRRERLAAMAIYKRDRRMQLADDVSLLWEDRSTILHQVQEMVRMEDGEEETEATFRLYQDIVPGPGRLTATLFIEVRDNATIKQALRKYARVEDHLRLAIGPLRVKPQVIGDHGSNEAATAVTYLAFEVPGEVWGHLGEAVLEVDHPRLTGAFPLPGAVAAAPV